MDLRIFLYLTNWYQLLHLFWHHRLGEVTCPQPPPSVCSYWCLICLLLKIPRNTSYVITENESHTNLLLFTGSRRWGRAPSSSRSTTAPTPRRGATRTCGSATWGSRRSSAQGSCLTASSTSEDTSSHCRWSGFSILWASLGTERLGNTNSYWMNCQSEPYKLKRHCILIFFKYL